MVEVTSLLDREVYLYAEVDRLVGTRPGTARRWINGYTRAGREYLPILRERPEETEWVTWGEFVEVRMLAEYRDKENVPIVRQRAAVQRLRELFEVPHPLAYLHPHLTVSDGDLLIERRLVDPHDDEGLMVVRTQQLLLDVSRDVLDTAALGDDELGRPFAIELAPDKRFDDIVVNPVRGGGQPTFRGRRVSVELIAGMAAAGEDEVELASGYGLSLAQVRSAVEYFEGHGRAA